jgi:RNA polymerase sigma-70 factor, ECF subfamily
VTEAGPAESAELADSLRLGFLTVLDQLKPVERAVFLMADVFGVPFAEISDTVGRSQPACRQIASRARLRARRPAELRDVGSDRLVVDALMLAIAAGDMDRVLAHLAPDAMCISDGGAAIRAARRPVVGAPRVARFLVNLAHRFPERLAVRPAIINGDNGVIVSVGGEVDLVTAFEVHGGQVTTVRMMRNPEKLAHVDHPVTMQ